MRVEVAVLREFNKKLEIEKIEVKPLKEGEILVELTASGVCGSDVHMWEGKDIRIKLPLVLGHEGIGIIREIKGKKEDIFGNRLQEGDKIIWDRGITCGKCYYCSIKKEPSLCINRKVYGISYQPTEVRPYLTGCYSKYIHLASGTKIIKIEKQEKSEDIKYVTASCSGATSAHAIELADIDVGDTVVIQGPGPIGIFSTVFARERGAKRIIIIGSSKSLDRLNLSKQFGATDILLRDKMTQQERIEYIKDITNGRGADVVVECSGSPKAIDEGLKIIAPLGKYVLPGIAVPVGDVPIDIYEVIRKNVSIIGVWVSDTSHFLKALNLIASNRYPFEKIITKQYSLSNATEALFDMKERKILKGVIVP